MHFIGTWRNRYRKRFSGLSSKITKAGSDASAAAASQKATVIHVDMVIEDLDFSERTIELLLFHFSPKTFPFLLMEMLAFLWLAFFVSQQKQCDVMKWGRWNDAYC